MSRPTLTTVKTDFQPQSFAAALRQSNEAAARLVRAYRSIAVAAFLAGAAIGGVSSWIVFRPAPVAAVHMWTADEVDAHFRNSHMQVQPQTELERSFGEVAGVGK